MLNGKDHPIVRRYIRAAHNIGSYTKAERSELLSQAADLYEVVRVQFALALIDPHDPTAFDIPTMLRAAGQESDGHRDEDLAVVLAHVAALLQFAVPRIRERFLDAYNADDDDPSPVQ